MAKPETTSNVKFRKLVTRLALPAPYVLGLLEMMWGYGQKQKSALLGDREDVELAAEWPGEKGKLFKVLKDLRWIDKNLQGFWEIHDFSDHAPDYVKRKIKEAADNKRLSGGFVQNIPDDSGEFAPSSPSPSPSTTSIPPSPPQGSPKQSGGEEEDAIAWELLRSEKKGSEREWSEPEIALAMATIETGGRSKAETVRIAVSNANHKKPGSRKRYIQKQLESGCELRRGAILIGDPNAKKAWREEELQRERDLQRQAIEHQNAARKAVAELSDADFEIHRAAVIEAFPERMRSILTSGEDPRKNDRLIFQIYERIKKPPVGAMP